MTQSPGNLNAAEFPMVAVSLHSERSVLLEATFLLVVPTVTPLCPGERFTAEIAESAETRIP